MKESLLNWIILIHYKNGKHHIFKVKETRTDMEKRCEDIIKDQEVIYINSYHNWKDMIYPDKEWSK